MTTTRDKIDKPKGRAMPSRRFEIFANPPMSERYTWQRADWSQATANWEMSDLVEKYGEEDVRNKMTEVLKSYAGGMVITGLFAEGGMENRGKRPRRGCSLTHIWVGPGFPLFRHSHPGSGDCLYYVTNGELIVGRRQSRAGIGVLHSRRHALQVHRRPERGRTPGVPPGRRRPGRAGLEGRRANDGFDAAARRRCQREPAQVAKARENRRHNPRRDRRNV